MNSQRSSSVHCKVSSGWFLNTALVSCPLSTLPCTKKLLATTKQRKARKQAQIFCSLFRFLSTVGRWARTYALRGEAFPFTRETASTERNAFLSTPFDHSLQNWEGSLYFFFLSFSDRDLCTKRESRTSSRDLKTRDSNPNLSAKVHEEAKQKGGTDFNIQHKRKRYLKVALSFCCKREEGCSTYAMKMCLYFVYFFFSFLFLVLFTNGRTDWTLAPNSWEQKQKNKQVL